MTQAINDARIWIAGDIITAGTFVAGTPAYPIAASNLNSIVVAPGTKLVVGGSKPLNVIGPALYSALGIPTLTTHANDFPTWCHNGIAYSDMEIWKAEGANITITCGNEPSRHSKPLDNCKIHFCRYLLSNVVGTDIAVIWTDDIHGDVTGPGDYDDIPYAFPDAISFYAIAITSGTELTLYKNKNYQGGVILQIIGPALLLNDHNADYATIMTKNLGATNNLQADFPTWCRQAINNNLMSTWGDGSCKIVCGQTPSINPALDGRTFDHHLPIQNCRVHFSSNILDSSLVTTVGNGVKHTSFVDYTTDVIVGSGNYYYYDVALKQSEPVFNIASIAIDDNTTLTIKDDTNTVVATYVGPLLVLSADALKIAPNTSLLSEVFANSGSNTTFAPNATPATRQWSSINFAYIGGGYLFGYSFVVTCGTRYPTTTTTTTQATTTTTTQATTTTTTTIAGTPCGQDAVAGTSKNDSRQVFLGLTIGIVPFTCNAYNVPDRFVVTWNGNVVIDSGSVSDSHNFTFLKSLVEPQYATVTVTCDSSSPTAWSYNLGCPIEVVTPTTTTTTTAAPDILSYLSEFDPTVTNITFNDSFWTNAESTDKYLLVVAGSGYTFEQARNIYLLDASVKFYYDINYTVQYFYGIAAGTHFYQRVNEINLVTGTNLSTLILGNWSTTTTNDYTAYYASIPLYYKKLYKLLKQAYNNVTITEMSNWTTFDTYCNNYLLSLTKVQRIEMFLTYKWKAFVNIMSPYNVNFINNFIIRSTSTISDSTYYDAMASYFESTAKFNTFCQRFTFGESNSNASIGGFAISLNDNNFRTINVEPDSVGSSFHYYSACPMLFKEEVSPGLVYKVGQFKVSGMDYTKKQITFSAISTWSATYPTTTDASFATLMMVEDYHKLIYVCIHESGHTIDYMYSKTHSGVRLSELSNWLSIAGWESLVYNGAANADNIAVGSSYYHLNTDNFNFPTLHSAKEAPVTPYGHFYPWEDFAEAWAMYVYNSAALQQFYPLKYAFITTVVVPFLNTFSGTTLKANPT